MARKRPAPYVPLSVYYADDEAIMEAGEDAELMYVRMLAYAGRTPTTEGYVPRRVCLTRLGIAVRPELGPETSPESRLERLTDTGLVAVEGDGYRLVSWLKWNRSVEEMNREREQDRTRKVPLTRASPERSPEKVPEVSPELGPESSPVPSGSTEEKRREEIKDLSARRGRFDEFWSIYPKRGKHSNPKEPARQKWNELVRTVDPEAIIASARVLAKVREGEDPQTTPQTITWLRQKRWQDDQPADTPVRHLQSVGPSREAQVRYEESQQVAPSPEALPW